MGQPLPCFQVTILHVHNSHLTAPFDFGPTDGTSFIALQPWLDASPMENVLWSNNGIIPNLKMFYSVCETWHFSLATFSFKLNVSRQVVH
jgi:hypothetical protein